ncbi:hypothetical protein [Rhizobium sp. Leaf453]|uniref:hypothetical protein n=1 Tax=Rhizobium sp. Leaf453 TaxID=1736380 RepID=UPI0012E3C48B|nr:hypothetical protein [Rhizobium sp. Leaf453]
MESGELDKPTDVEWLNPVYVKIADRPRERISGPAQAVPDRPLRKARNVVTETGASKIEGEITSLKDRVVRASSDKDRSLFSRELRYWEARRKSMEIVPTPNDIDQVQFETAVVVERGGTRRNSPS